MKNNPVVNPHINFSPAPPETMKRLLIFGAGGHGRELAWIARRCLPASVRVEFVVDRPEFWKRSVAGCRVHLFEDLEPDAATAFIAALGDPKSRRIAAAKMSANFAATSLADPSIICSERVFASPGSVVMPGCVLTTNIHIGGHAHINIGCRLSHDVTIGDFATLSPAVCLAGNIRIGQGAFLGIGASVINGSPSAPLVIGHGAVVAAGACVTKNVPPGAMVAGVPAVIKRHAPSPAGEPAVHLSPE